MTDSSQKKFALLSVTDKTGITDFAKGLKELGYTILSTGGTAKIVKGAGIDVIDVSDFTGSPEMLSGRVKTLHPKVHGGILWDRSSTEHQKEVAQFEIGSIDIVAVNLYAFHKKAVGENLSLPDAIEHIDIGGPTMLRSAAKNWQHTCPIVDPNDYQKVLNAIAEKKLDESVRLELALKVFSYTAYYDASISQYFQKQGENLTRPKHDALPIEEVSELRYGENPHQKARLLKHPISELSFDQAEIIQGKQLSYNNLLDLNAAANLSRDLLPKRGIAIIKHTNPCGCAVELNASEPTSEIYKRALAGDPKSAFGGIISINHPIDSDTATLISELFVECIVAPEFSKDALDVFANKKNLRILKADFAGIGLGIAKEYRSIEGGFLEQERDATSSENQSTWSLATETKASESQLADLEFANQVCGHVKSNAIVLAFNNSTLTIGAGQMSRIDALEFAIQKAGQEGKDLSQAVLASDAFFPFSDCVEIAAKHGIKAIVQPGGSKRDQDSIDMANKNNIPMYFTGKRHFKH